MSGSGLKPLSRHPILQAGGQEGSGGLAPRLGRASSINVRKVLWTCAEIGIDHRREDWGNGFAPTNTPEFLGMNPNGLVPVIANESGTLWESNTICRDLAARHGRTDLLPESPGIAPAWNSGWTGRRPI
jgi:glutathione S-transferase